MHEPLPLSKIQGAVLQFLQGRDDAVLFGAQAVNAYVDEPRATQDVDVMSNNAAEFAETLRLHLSDLFHIAVRVREIRGKGYRLYQTRKEGNRHLVDVRIQPKLPHSQQVERINVLTPAELIASKVTSFRSRYGQSKAWTDRRDLAVMLARFPELREQEGEVHRILVAQDVGGDSLGFWKELVDEQLVKEDEDDDLNY